MSKNVKVIVTKMADFLDFLKEHLAEGEHTVKVTVQDNDAWPFSGGRKVREMVGHRLVRKSTYTGLAGQVDIKELYERVSGEKWPERKTDRPYSGPKWVPGFEGYVKRSLPKGRTYLVLNMTEEHRKDCKTAWYCSGTMDDFDPGNGPWAQYLPGRRNGLVAHPVMVDLSKILEITIDGDTYVPFVDGVVTGED